MVRFHVIHCQFFYADALIVCFQNQFSGFIVQHNSHLLCLCYTSFSKVKELCCIIENCYKLPIIDHDLDLSLDDQDHVETVCALSRQEQQKQSRR